MSIMRSPNFLPYLENQEAQIAALIQAADGLSLVQSHIANRESHPQLRLTVKRGTMRYTVLRYSKDTWRVFAISETVESELREMFGPYTADFYRQRNQNTEDQTLPRIEAAIAYMQKLHKH